VDFSDDGEGFAGLVGAGGLAAGLHRPRGLAGRIRRACPGDTITAGFGHTYFAETLVLEIHPKEIHGSWDNGYVLDVHTISSTFIGNNEFGHPEFDTVRSQLGEAIYRLKYKGDKTVIPQVVEAVVEFIRGWGIHPDVIVPIPPSRLDRPFQPVIEIARELAQHLGVRLNATSLKKNC
jgi:hypothetical protein